MSIFAAPAEQQKPAPGAGALYRRRYYIQGGGSSAAPEGVDQNRECSTEKEKRVKRGMYRHIAAGLYRKTAEEKQHNQQENRQSELHTAIGGKDVREYPGSLGWFQLGHQCED